MTSYEDGAWTVFHSCVHTNHDGSAVRGEVSIARHDEPPIRYRAVRSGGRSGA